MELPPASLLPIPPSAVEKEKGKMRVCSENVDPVLGSRLAAELRHDSLWHEAMRGPRGSCCPAPNPSPRHLCDLGGDDLEGRTRKAF